MNKVKILLICASIVLIPSIASADIPDAFKEYVTHGDFNEISNAFERVAIVFSDVGFEHFITVFFVGSVFAWLAMAVVGTRMFSAVPQSVLLQSAVYILAGVLIYMALIEPKTEMAVYDTTTNQHMIIADMPQGVVLIAGTQNKIKEAIIDMIWTSSDPDSYLANAGGDIFNILTHVFDKKKFTPAVDDSSGQLLNKSIQLYWKNCSIYAAGGPTGNFDINKLHDGSSTLIEVLSDLQNGSQYTKTYLGGSDSGKRATCTEAFTLIETELNNLTESGTGNKFWEERCGAAGCYDQINATGTPAVEVCKNKTIDFLASQVPALVDSISLVRQFIVANALQGYIKKNDIISLSNFKIMTGSMGEAASASNWVPVIKGVVFAVYIGLIPFLLMLLPTMLSLRVIQFLLGIFVFMICWNTCDAILHSYAMDRSIAMMRDIFDGTNNLSLLDIWLMRDESMKSLILFGKMRWTSMMLAAVVSSVIARYGGIALAHFAGQMNFSGKSSQASDEIFDPESRASDLRQLPNAAPTEAIYNQYGSSAMARQFMMTQEAGIMSSAGIVNAAGGGPEAVSQIANNQTMQHRTSVGDTAGRHQVEGETGWRPEDVATGKAYAGGLGDIGRSQSATDMGATQSTQSTRLSSDMQAMHALKITLGNAAMNGSTHEQLQEMAGDAMLNKGAVVDANGVGSKYNPVMETAFNASGSVIMRPITDEQKGNIAKFINAASDSNVSASDIAATTTMNMGYHDRNLRVTDATGVEGVHSTTYHDNSDEIYGDGVQFEPGSMMDALGNNKFVGSDIDVIGHRDAAIAEFTKNVQTMFSENQQSSIANRTNVNIGSNSSKGGLGTGYSMNKGNVVSENQVNAHMHEQLEGVTSNLEAQEIMQESYDYYKNYHSITTDMMSVRNMENSLQNAKSFVKDGLEKFTKDRD